MMMVVCLLLLCAGLVGIGCGAIDSFVDCNQICNRYKDCVDSSYDAASCRDTCYQKSREDASYNSKANECDACLADRACSQSLPCTIQCAGIVP